MTERNRLEKKLKNLKVNEFSENSPELPDKKSGVIELLTGKCVGRIICHS